MTGALAYRARKDRVHLRILAYRPQIEPVPEGQLKILVQVFNKGELIVDPIHTENMLPLDLARALHISRFDGWDIEPWERSH